jgi:hypothetical protein
MLTAYPNATKDWLNVPLPALGTMMLSPVALLMARITRLFPPPVTVTVTPPAVACGEPGFWLGFWPGFAIAGIATAKSIANTIASEINFFMF